MSASHAQVRTRPDVPLVQKRTAKASLVQKLNPEPKSSDIAQETTHRKASVMFDMACIAFGEKNLALAQRVTDGTGQAVSESIVSRWRNAEQRDVPNEAQLLALGSEFNRLYYRLKNQHFGWGRKTLIDLVEALSDVVVTQSEE